MNVIAFAEHLWLYSSQHCELGPAFKEFCHPILRLKDCLVNAHISWPTLSILLLKAYRVSFEDEWNRHWFSRMESSFKKIFHFFFSINFSLFSHLNIINKTSGVCEWICRSKCQYFLHIFHFNCIVNDIIIFNLVTLPMLSFVIFVE